MTIDERVEWCIDQKGGRPLFGDEACEIIKQAITAAVEEERKDERKACAEMARKVRTGTTNEWVRRTSEDIEALILARSPKD